MITNISISIRDVIDPHDERASELISEVTATRPGNFAVGSPAVNVLSTRSTVVGSESSKAHSSVTTTRNSRGNSGNTGSRFFYVYYTECNTSVISESNLIHRSIIPDDKMQTVGRIVIRGAFGAPVQTDVALLSIKPAVSDTNTAPPLDVMFAVCDELNER